MQSGQGLARPPSRQLNGLGTVGGKPPSLIQIHFSAPPPQIQLGGAGKPTSRLLGGRIHHKAVHLWCSPQAKVRISSC